MPKILPLLCCSLLLSTLVGCDSSRKEPAAPSKTTQSAPAATATAPVAAPPAAKGEVQKETGKEAKAEPQPPSPPIEENFDSTPHLSLFARLGSFRPAESNSQGLSYWRTYLDHLLRTSGPVNGAGRDGSRAWAVRGIKGLDSVGFFAPLEVQPSTTYRVRFALKGVLPKGASAGIGVMEYDKFFWIGRQFTQDFSRQHQTGTQEGLRLQGSKDWQEHTFTFTTAPATHMIHLVLFRDGPTERQPVFFDDIAIAAAADGKAKP